MAKKQVFFIATKAKKEPAEVSFYTKKGERVTFDAVKKVRTKEGVQFYAEPGKLRKR